MNQSTETAGPVSAEAAPPARRPRQWIHLPRSPARRALFVAVYALFCFGLWVAADKFYWKMHAGVPLTDAPTILDRYYPEVRISGTLDAQISHDDDSFDVLILGGSVLEPAWGDIEKLLSEKLRETRGDRFRIFNLARVAHTSRDSLLKYRRLEGQQFDLVIVCDGINDVRMNCCPPEMFRDDYTHCSWYRAIEERLAAGVLNFSNVVLDEISKRPSIPPGEPDDSFREFGRKIKTPRAYRKNLEEIAALALARGDTLLLLTYAWHIPADYTRERFAAGELDYTFLPGKPRCGAEMWGLPECIGPTIAAQNAALRELAAGHPEVLLVDQEQAMAGNGEYFVDPCHVTEAGSRRFVEILWPAVAPLASGGRQPPEQSGRAAE